MNLKTKPLGGPMKQTLAILAVLALVPGAALAEDRVLPAQADDIARADANLGAAAKGKKPNEAKGSAQSDEEESSEGRDNFGSEVSAEAKALKDADKETRKAFGAAVSSKRRKDGDRRAQAGASAGQSGASVGGAPSEPLGQVPPQGDAARGSRPGGRPQ
jgi:hypothetical protein